MSYCFRRPLIKSSPLFISSKCCHQKFFSILYPINHKINNLQKEKFQSLKTYEANHTRCRYFSLGELSSNIYHSVTTSDASIFLKDSLIQIHDLTGIPWWGTIFFSTLAIKLCIGFPISVYQQYLNAKIKLTKVELEGISKNLKKKVLGDAKRENWPPTKTKLVYSREVRKQWKILVVKNNCHPFKNVILSLSQLPIWILLSLTLRKFAYDVHTGTADDIAAALQFQVGGLFWCPNLTLPDSTCIFPAIITLCSFLSVEINALSNTHILHFIPRVVTYVLRFFVLLSLLISLFMPSCVTLFWATSSSLNLAQTLLLMSPRVRKMLRIPKTPGDFEYPYSRLANEFGKKCWNFGRRISDLIHKK